MENCIVIAKQIEFYNQKKNELNVYFELKILTNFNHFLMAKIDEISLKYILKNIILFSLIIFNNT